MLKRAFFIAVWSSLLLVSTPAKADDPVQLHYQSKYNSDVKTILDLLYWSKCGSSSLLTWVASGYSTALNPTLATLAFNLVTQRAAEICVTEDGHYQQGEQISRGIASVQIGSRIFKVYRVTQQGHCYCNAGAGSNEFEEGYEGDDGYDGYGGYGNSDFPLFPGANE